MVPAAVGSIMVVSTLTYCVLLPVVCDLKDAQMNVQSNSEIYALRVQMGAQCHRNKQNIYCTKSEDTVDESIVNRWFKKFCLSCKN